MPYKDKELARQYQREYRARRRQDPEWLKKQAAHKKERYAKDPEKFNLRVKKYRQENKDETRERHRKWVSKNRERYLEIMKRSRHKRIKEISKSYVAGLFRISMKDLSDDLYEAYAAALKTQRLIKEMMK